MENTALDIEKQVKELLTNTPRPLAEIVRELHCPKGYTFGPHKHERLEINVVSKGSCTMQFNNDVVGFNKNDCMIVFPNVSHYFEALKTDVILVQLEFNLNIFPVLQTISLDKQIALLQSIYTNEQQFIKICGHLEINNLVQQIVDEIQQQRENYATLTRLLYAQLFLVVSRYIKETLFFSVTTTNRVLLHSLGYIQTHFTENMSIQQIGSQCGVSDRYLRKLFFQHLRMCPVNYIQSLRIRLAKDLISKRNSSLKEIAYLCGFSSPQYFSNKFKKHTGMTPLAYQRLLYRKL